MLLYSAMLATLLAGLTPAAGHVWEIERVDNGKYFWELTDRSMRLDSTGHLHVAYGGDWLYYAHHDGSSWQTETIDSERYVGWYASLALDKDAFPHISHYKQADGDLKYAYKDCTGWHVETVDSVGVVGAWTSIAVDDAGFPHITYQGSHALKYAHRRTDKEWQITTVDSELSAGAYSSVALDAAGFPHISYQRRISPDEDLKYAYRDSTGWSIEKVDSIGAVGAWSSLVLDGEGFPHISYEGNANLKYACKYSGDWTVETVDSEGWVGTYTSLGLNAAGHPHISYHDETNDDLRVARKGSSGWEIETIDCEGLVGWFTSLAVDPNDQLHIIYCQVRDGFGFQFSPWQLRHAYEDQQGWHIEVVDNAGIVGLHTDMALGENDYPHLSYGRYYHLGGTAFVEELRYSVFDGVEWHIEIVDSTGAVGEYSSLAVEAGTYPHISYYDRTNRDLKYAHKDVSGWQTETVESEGDVGEYTSLALDAGGSPHISYQCDYSWDDRRLKYAFKTALGWVRATVVSGYGSYTSLVLDAADRPHICFCKTADSGQPEDLRYAHCDGTTWRIDIVDSDEGVGEGLSLSLDNAGYPHISYHAGYPHYSLKYAYHDIAGWHIETVCSQDGTYTSLVLDDQNRPCISYYEAGDLKYAHRSSTGWQFETVDSLGHVGWYASVALNGAGYPCIGYHDWSLFDMKYASCEGVAVEEGSGLFTYADALLLCISPNPTHTRAMITFRVGNEAVRHVSLRVYDPMGRLVADRRKAVLSGLTQTAEWDLRYENGRRAPSGVYYVGVTSGDDAASGLCPLVIVR